MRKYSQLTNAEKLRLLYAKLLIQNTEKVSIETIERDLNMVDMDGNPYEYEIPEFFEEGDCVIFRYKSDQLTAMDLSNTIQSISEYCPNVNMIFMDKELQLMPHTIDPEDYNSFVSILGKYFDLENSPEDEDDDDYLDEEDIDNEEDDEE